MFNTKADIYAFTRKVYSRLGREDYMFRLIKKKELHGQCFKGCRWIELNPDGEIVSTLVHEVLHDIYQDWSEEKVAANERLLMAQLSHRQCINLGKALFKKLDYCSKIKI
jgi:hypothetical protein